MTFRLDSDILFAYGGITEVSTGKKIAPARNRTWKQPDENFSGEKSFKTFML